ncbi:MAG: hypothetical protein Q8N99_02395 [Nanoarchaeota archaeon]|nr:hypothetical protein [Nanoarchaeota archaeon]
MKVQKKRWGEVTIKKQGEGKNQFDTSKSFSIEQSSTNYNIEEYKEILEIVTDLTEKLPFKYLKDRLGQEQKDLESIKSKGG